MPRYAPVIPLALALAACASVQEPEPVPPHEYSEYTGPQPGFLSLPQLGCTARACGEAVVADPRGRLPRAADVLATAYPGGVPYVAVLPAGRNAPDIVLATEAVDEPLRGQGIEPDPEGGYTIHSFAVDGPGCAVTDIDLETQTRDDDGTGESGETPDGLPGGICGTLAIAHSLVYKLSVIKENWDGVLDGTDWAADFLKAIYRATGDDDGNRDITQDEVDEAHEADWNRKWDVEQSKDWEKKPEDGDCDELQEWCEELELLRDTRGHDCILNTRRPQSGHLMTVDTVRWNEATCRCVIETVNTGQQDGPAADFAGVPKNPGKQTWELGPNEEIGVTAGPSASFYTNLRYQDAWFACYEKDSVRGVRRDEPGSAFPRRP